MSDNFSSAFLSSKSHRVEIDPLLNALDALKGGQGRVIEIAGAPGMGKSRLLAALSAKAEALGLPVLNRHYADSLGEPGAGGPSGRTGSGRLPHQPPDPAGDRPAVVLLDDFHCSGEDGVDLVERLMRRAATTPLLLVVAHRPKQLTPPLRSALARRVELGTVQRIDLQPLTLAESSRMLGLPVADEHLRELHRLSHGVPLFLLALAETGPAGAVPERYAAPVLAEIGRLDPDALATARAVCVLGGSCDREAIAAVAELTVAQAAEALVCLVRQDVLRSVDSVRFSYRHPLLCRLAAQETDPVWKVAAHRRAATFLAGRAATAAERAVHLEHCLGDPLPDDVLVLRRAAEQALLTDPASAARWLRAALSIASCDTGELRRALTTMLARAVGVSGRLEESRDLLHALRSADDTMPPETTAFYAEVEFLLGNYAEARALLGEELKRCERLPQPPLEAAQLIVMEGVVAAMNGRTLPAGQTDYALGIARAHRAVLAEAAVLALIGLSRLLEASTSSDAALDPTPDDASDNGAAGALAASARLIDRLTDLDLAAHPMFLAVLAWAETLGCDFDSAQRHFARGTAIARKYGQCSIQPVFMLGLAITHLQIGRPALTRELAHEAQWIAEGCNARHLRGFAIAIEALGSAWTDADGRAVRLAEEAVAAMHGERFYWAHATAIALAVTARLHGNRRRAVTLVFDTGGGPELEDLPMALRARCFELLAGAVMESGRPFSGPADPVQTSDGWARRAEAVARATGHASHAAHAMVARGHALRTRGDVPAALDRYRAAGQLFSSLGMLRHQALALISSASCAAAVSQAEDEASMLQFAEELAERIGSATIVGILRQLRAPVPAPVAMAQLTPREREIAAMAGDGRKTREIAKELSLSPRTVEVHLTRIYRKLNVGSRTSLALLLAGSVTPIAAPVAAGTRTARAW